MSTIIRENVELETVTFQCCGVTAAYPKSFITGRRESGGQFYCPNGHSAVFAKSVVEKLRDELSVKTKTLEATKLALTVKQRECEQILGAARKQSARVRVGVCPCCNRSFTDLRQHMASKHPEKGAKPKQFRPALTIA